jgi:hypothetical protein
MTNDDIAGADCIGNSFLPTRKYGINAKKL